MKVIKQDIMGMTARQGELADEIEELLQKGKNFNNTNLVFVHQVIPEGNGQYTIIFNVCEDEEPAVVKPNSYTTK